MTSILNIIKDCLSDKSKLKSALNINQKAILSTIIDSNLVSVIKPRQAGVTTALLYYVANLMKYSNKRKSIALFEPNYSTGEDFLKKLGFLLRGYYENNLRVNKKDLYLEGSYFKVMHDYDKLIGARYDVIIIDEAAHNKNLDNILLNSYASLSEGGKLICVSSCGGISDGVFKKFHFDIRGNGSEVYQKHLIIEKKSFKGPRALEIINIRCDKKSSTELKKEKLNIY
jgi:hypothetical protein